MYRRYDPLGCMWRNLSGEQSKQALQLADKFHLIRVRRDGTGPATFSFVDADGQDTTVTILRDGTVLSALDDPPQKEEKCHQNPHQILEQFLSRSL